MLEQITGLLNAIRDRVSPPLLDIPAGRGLRLVRDGYKVIPTDTRGPTRAHLFGDLAGLLAYVKRHGEPPATTLFCDRAKFVAVLRDVDGNDRDWLAYTPVPTEAARFWERMGAMKMVHRELKKAIEDHAKDVQTQGLLVALSHFQHRVEVTYAAELEDAETVSFIVKKQGATGAGGQARMPKEFEVAIPLFIGWEKVYTLAYRLSFEPEGQAVVFQIEQRDWREVAERAVGDLIAHAREQLGEGWLVVRGTPALGPALGPAPGSMR
jgi:hypothetical protein